MDDSHFADKTDEELGGVCWDLHCSPYCCVCTSAAETCIRAAAEVYEIEVATRLLPLYQKYTQLRQDIWALHGDFYPPMDKFCTHSFRVQIAEKLREMGRTCDDILYVFEDAYPE